MTAWKRLDDWVGTQVEDHYVMIHLESGRYVALNDTAAHTWQSLETQKNEDAIVAELTREFEIDEQKCSQSVATLLETMRDMGIVAPA